MPLPITLDQPITFNSRLCHDTCITLESTDGNFCFQLPLFEETGTNLLSSSEINYVQEFGYTVSTNEAVDTSPSGTSCGSPFNDFQQTLDAFTLGLQLSEAGKYFFRVGLGDVSITNAINYSDNTPKELVVSLRDGTLAREDEQELDSSDQNEELFWKGSTDWVALDEPSLWIKARSECDDTNEEIIYDLDVDSYRAYPSFSEDTYTGEDDTFYRLQFSLDKTSSVLVSVVDSGGTTIIEENYTGPVYDKIFNTGTLPVDKTLTVRWEITDMTEYPNASFNLSVLTEVSVTKMCKWDMDIKDSSGNLLSGSGINMVETHDTTTLDVDGVSYNANIQYCIDLSLVSSGTYNFVATDSCDIYTEYDSNDWRICDSDCNYYSKLSWDHSNIKFNGNYQLDYFNYTYVPFFRVRMDLQDLTQEYEAVIYRDAAGFLQNPYSFYRNIQILQISGVAGYMRRAIALAMSDVFMIDNVEYRKIDDEDISPLFPATDPNAIRVLVTKVGDFMESKNV